VKKVLSISLGSSKRDHIVETEMLGEKFLIERKGTDGDKKKARELFLEFDGKYDAFGLGGIDLYIYASGRRYTFKDAKKLISNVKKTPVVDGSGLKNTLERRVIKYIYENTDINISDKKVLMVSAMDRFGMAEAFSEFGAKLFCGDLIFALGIPVLIKSIKILSIVAFVVAPIVTKLPFELIYPTGKKQEKRSVFKRYSRFYHDADIIAGDFHYIKRYIPEQLNKKIIITNTVTKKDVEDLKNIGVKYLITTTPELNGRSFGTNVMESVLITLAGKSPENLNSDEYSNLLDKINFKPRIIKFDWNYKRL